MEICVKRTFNHTLPLPKQATSYSAGFDLCSAEGFVLPARKQKLFSTGFAFEIPKGFAGFIWPRSGMAVKKGIDVLAGLIDSDYRGELKVCLINHGFYPCPIEMGDRIAQLVISSVWHGESIEVSQLESTERNEGGFGSTGK